MKRIKVVQDRTQIQFFDGGIEVSTSIKVRKLLTGRLTVFTKDYIPCFQRQNTSEVSNPVILEHVKSVGELCPMLNSTLRHEGSRRNWVKARRILNHGTRWWWMFNFMAWSL